MSNYTTRVSQDWNTSINNEDQTWVKVSVSPYLKGVFIKDQDRDIVAISLEDLQQHFLNLGYRLEKKE